MQYYTNHFLVPDLTLSTCLKLQQFQSTLKLSKCGTLQSLLCKRAGFDPFSSFEATIQSRDQLHQHQQTLLFQCDTYQRNVFQFLIASIKNLETFATNPHQPSKMKRMVWYTHSLRNKLKENEEKVEVVFLSKLFYSQISSNLESCKSNG